MSKKSKSRSLIEARLHEAKERYAEAQQALAVAATKVDTLRNLIMALDDPTAVTGQKARVKGSRKPTTATPSSVTGGSAASNTNTVAA